MPTQHLASKNLLEDGTLDVQVGDRNNSFSLLTEREGELGLEEKVRIKMIFGLNENRKCHIQLNDYINLSLSASLVMRDNGWPTYSLILDTRKTK